MGLALDIGVPSEHRFWHLSLIRRADTIEKLDGYCPVYVGLVTDQPEPVYRIPSPRRYPPRVRS